MKNVIPLSFSDCPYGCVDGKLFNTVLGLQEECPFCREKREKILKENITLDTEDEKIELDLYKELNIPEYYRGIEYNFDTVITDANRLSEDSVELVHKTLDDIYNKINLGNTPNCSVLVNLGAGGNIFSFIYPYILKAYKFGVTVTPLLSNVDLVREITKFERGFDNNYIDWLDSKLSVITLQAGITNNGVAVVRGYMQERAKRGKSTLIFTNAKVDKIIEDLLCEKDDSVSLHLAKLITVKYISKKSMENNIETAGKDAHTSSNGGKSVISMEELMKQNS